MRPEPRVPAHGNHRRVNMQLDLFDEFPGRRVNNSKKHFKVSPLSGIVGQRNEKEYTCVDKKEAGCLLKDLKRDG